MSGEIVVSAVGASGLTTRLTRRFGIVQGSVNEAYVSKIRPSLYVVPPSRKRGFAAGGTIPSARS